MINIINNLIGSDGGNHHPLNITTCKEAIMSKLIYRTKNYRKIYEQYHNVKLKPGIDVHHIDGDRNNNSIENLKAVTREEHIKIHIKQGQYHAANLLSKGRVDVSGKRNPMYGIEPWNKGKKVGYTWNKGVTGYKNNYPKNRKSPKFDEERLNKHKKRMKLWWNERKGVYNGK